MNATFLSQNCPNLNHLLDSFGYHSCYFLDLGVGCSRMCLAKEKERKKKPSHLRYNLRLGRGTIGHEQKAVI